MVAEVETTMAGRVATSPTRASDVGDHLQQALRLSGLCTLCGSCMPYCPTYRETLFESSGPRGRITLVRAVAQGQLPIAEAVEAIDECLGCRACEPPCPAGVKWGPVLEHFRAATVLGGLQSGFPRLLQRWVFRLLLGTPAGLRIATTMLRLYQRTGLRRMAHAVGLAPKIAGAAAELDLIVPPAPSRRERSRAYQAASGTRGGRQTSGRAPRVGFFTGCIQDIAFSNVNAAAIRVLAAVGCEVVIPPGQACCGAVQAHAGEHRLAVMQAKRNIAAAAKMDLDYIVIAAGGCAATMKDYPELLGNSAESATIEAARSFSSKVREFTEIVDQLGLPTMGSIEAAAVTYQDSCLMRNVQKITDQPRKLLNAVPGIRLVELTADGCCGAGGIYNLSHPEMSGRILDRKMENIKDSGADVVCVANLPCQMQLLMGTKRRGLDGRLKVKHIAEILDEAITLGHRRAGQS